MPDDAEPDVVYVVPTPPPARIVRSALVAGVITAVALAALVGWLGFRTYQAERDDAQRALFVRTAQDVAVNLSTVDYEHADADAERIADAAVGAFAESFAQHKQTYINNAKHAKTRSLGTVTDAGLESQNGDQGRVLVAVTVKSTDAGGQAPQYFRMRIAVQKVGDIAKVSDVAFVS
jgi:Mce-associated membrane protein